MVWIAAWAFATASVASASSRSRRRATAKTGVPRAERIRQKAAPIPDDAPVTIASSAPIQGAELRPTLERPVRLPPAIRLVAHLLVDALADPFAHLAVAAHPPHLPH